MALHLHCLISWLQVETLTSFESPHVLACVTGNDNSMEHLRKERWCTCISVPRTLNHVLWQLGVRFPCSLLPCKHSFIKLTWPFKRLWWKPFAMNDAMALVGSSYGNPTSGIPSKFHKSWAVQIHVNVEGVLLGKCILKKTIKKSRFKKIQTDIKTQRTN